MTYTEFASDKLNVYNACETFLLNISSEGSFFPPSTCKASLQLLADLAVCDRRLQFDKEAAGRFYINAIIMEAMHCADHKVFLITEPQLNGSVSVQGQSHVLTGNSDYLVAKAKDNLTEEVIKQRLATGKLRPLSRRLLVEAKVFEKFQKGGAQLLAQMCIARSLDGIDGSLDSKPYFGCVSDGKIFEFYELVGSQLRISKLFSVEKDLEQILGMFVFMIESAYGDQMTANPAPVSDPLTTDLVLCCALGPNMSSAHPQTTTTTSTAMATNLTKVSVSSSGYPFSEEEEIPTPLDEDLDRSVSNFHLGDAVKKTGSNKLKTVSKQAAHKDNTLSGSEVENAPRARAYLDRVTKNNKPKPDPSSFKRKRQADALEVGANTYNSDIDTSLPKRKRLAVSKVRSPEAKQVLKGKGKLTHDNSKSISRR